MGQFGNQPDFGTAIETVSAFPRYTTHVGRSVSRISETLKRVSIMYHLTGESVLRSM